LEGNKTVFLSSKSKAKAVDALVSMIGSQQDEKAGQDPIEDAFNYYGRLQERQIAQFASRQHHLKSSVILDAGCGDMRYSKIIAENARECLVISTDISSANIASHLENKPKENHAPIVCDLRALPIRPNIVDGIVVMNVFHHLQTSKSLSQVLDEFRRICRRGARIFVKENVSNNPIRFIIERVYWILPTAFLGRMEITVDPYSNARKLPRDYHLFRFRAEQLESTLERHGFHVTAEERQDLFLYATGYFLKATRPLTSFLNRVLPFAHFAFEMERSLLKHYPFREFCLSVSLDATMQSAS
jgi:ubiquinone/menaquinone biosynthesis C-methylase UbiE